MKILNLRSGLGGNRKLWKGHEITSVDINYYVCKYYIDHYKEDTMLCEDAREYLLNNFREFDFIWSSDPCPTHSRARFWASKGGKIDPVYPDFGLYETIVFLDNYFDGLWVVENVKPYYKPLIQPTKQIGRHLFWSNFNIGNPPDFKEADIKEGKISEWEDLHGIYLKDYKFDVRKDKLLRNCVHPKTGKYILDCAMGTMQDYKTNQIDLFDQIKELENKNNMI